MRLPAERLLGTGRVGTTTLRVVLRHLLVNDRDALGVQAFLLLNLFDNVTDGLGELEDREFVGAAKR